MKRGVVDIGTNSVRLLIAKIQDGEIAEGRKYIRIIRLGEAVDSRGRIGEAAIRRCLEALGEFVRIAKAEGIETLHALATSALRDAQNREEVLRRIQSTWPIEVEIVDGEKEAEMGFRGVLSSLDFDGACLMIDIGGGSTEFVVGDKEKILYRKSLDIGAVRMTEQFITSDPVDSKQARKLSEHVQTMLRRGLSDMPAVQEVLLIGIGGTITTLAAVKLHMNRYDREKIQMAKVSRDEVRALVATFETLPLDERKSIPGLAPERADIIFAGSVILERILTFFDHGEIIVSDCDNLEGYLLTKIL